ncbi:MAG: hypothetical protein JHD16_00525 [Solirubrobacteraceae bacterium]|nr:hypothetical protein [Solirubrobacteraceae bacterium]
MTETITTVLARAEAALAGSAIGHLPRPARLAVLDALGDYERRGVGHQRRFTIALGAHGKLDIPRLTLAGDLSLPLLDGRWNDPILDNARDVAVRALRDTGDARDLRASVARARERLTERTKATAGVVLAARASLALVTAALDDQPAPPERRDLDDENLDPDDWGVEFCANSARTGLPSERRDEPARRAFWAYWLQSAKQHAAMRSVLDAPLPGRA